MILSHLKELTLLVQVNDIKLSEKLSCSFERYSQKVLHFTLFTSKTSQLFFNSYGELSRRADGDHVEVKMCG